MFPMGAYAHTGDLTVPQWIEYARLARELGYHGFWVAEESGKEAFTLLAIVGSQVPEIELGLGIVSVYARTPTMLAMETQTLEQVVGPRVVLGVGTGGIGFVERGHGLKIERPLARVRESVAIVRALLRGERLTHAGDFFQLHSFRLRERGIRPNPPLFISALNPKMIQLAGEIADGVVLNWLTPSYIRDVVRPNLKLGADRVGRDPAAVRIATLTPTCCDPNAEDARWALKRMIGFYCASPHYHRIVAHEGQHWLELARQIKAVWESGDFDRATAMVPDEMPALFALTGDPDQTRPRLEAYQQEGVYPIIYPIPRRDHLFEDYLAALRLVPAILPDR
jgi:5,10-methylenetetrahydromethanopterin reductase